MYHHGMDLKHMNDRPIQNPNSNIMADVVVVSGGISSKGGALIVANFNSS